MDLSEMTTKIIDWLDRTDITQSVVIDIVNITIKEIERDWNYRGMQIVTTGTLSVDNVSFPSNYKDLKSMFITTPDGEKLLQKKEWTYINSVYPTTSETGTPELCASKHEESKIYVRPYPDSNYSYTITSYCYTPTLPYGGTDTNWLLTNHWDAVLFGSLKNLSPYIKDMNMIQAHIAKYEQAIKQIRMAEIKESLTGSYQNIASNFSV